MPLRKGVIFRNERMRKIRESNRRRNKKKGEKRVIDILEVTVCRLQRDRRVEEHKVQSQRE
jgi:hypothetical protein